MRKLLQILGAVFAVLLVILIAGIAYAAWTGRKLDDSAQHYVDTSIPAIVGTWSEDALKVRSAPQLMQGITPEQFSHLFQWFARLGPMKEYCGSRGSSNVFVSANRGRTVSAHYTACAHFEHGDASIDVSLLQDSKGIWSIAGFRVNSPALLPP